MRRKRWTKRRGSASKCGAESELGERTDDAEKKCYRMRMPVLVDSLAMEEEMIGRRGMIVGDDERKAAIAHGQKMTR